MELLYQYRPLYLRQTAESVIKNFMHFRDGVRTHPTLLVRLRHCAEISGMSLTQAEYKPIVSQILLPWQQWSSLGNFEWCH